MKPLDPKEDVVFKLLMVRNPELLRQMLEAVLHVKVGRFRIRNPELPGGLRTDKHVALDVRVETTEGPRFDVEMQTYSDRALKQRMLFYWARLYGCETRQVAASFPTTCSCTCCSLPICIVPFTINASRKSCTGRGS